MSIEVGDRVRLSERGRRHHRRHIHDRPGTVVVNKRRIKPDDDHVLVRWDQVKTPVPVPRVWLELVRE